MSEEAAKACIERMKTDGAFRDSVMAAEDVDERMALIRAAGFDCTLEEIEAQGHPLTDAQLAEDSGGASCGVAAPGTCMGYGPLSECFNGLCQEFGPH